jgi:hypothetical protein
LKPPSSAKPQDLKDYAKRLADLGKKWSPVFDAYRQATQVAGVPSSEVEAELKRLEADDPVFNELVAEVRELSAQEEVFAQDLARTMEGISKSAEQIISGYQSADALNSQLSRMSDGLSHDTLEQIRSMERGARERLLQYQYYWAKAYEYEMLQPYPGNYQLGHLLDEVTRLLSPPINADPNWLDDPAHFQALKAVYQSELAATASTIWTKVNTGAPARTSEISFRLSPAQLQALNTKGEVTINLVEDGFISPALQNVKILDIGAGDVHATMTGPFAQLANVRFEFEHSGVSAVQTGGSRYVFRHQRSSADDPIFWATDYDAIRNHLQQAEISPSQIATVAALLQLNPAALGADEAARLYAHPGAWANITIRRVETVVPAGVAVQLDDVTLFVRYDSERRQARTFVLDVAANDGPLPQIAVSQPDHSGHTDGQGHFIRYFDDGQVVTLTAQPTYGRYKFSHWQDSQGVPLGQEPQLTLTLNQDRQIRAVSELD